MASCFRNHFITLLPCCFSNSPDSSNVFQRLVFLYIPFYSPVIYEARIYFEHNIQLITKGKGQEKYNRKSTKLW